MSKIRERYQQQVQQYQQLLAQGMPSQQAFQQAFPNGIPTQQDYAAEQAKEQQKTGIGAIGGTLAGALGTGYLVRKIPEWMAPAAAEAATAAAPAAGGFTGIGSAIGPVASGGEYGAMLAGEGLTSAGLTGGSGTGGGFGGVLSGGVPTPNIVGANVTPGLAAAAPLQSATIPGLGVGATAGALLGGTVLGGKLLAKGLSKAFGRDDDIPRPYVPEEILVSQDMLDRSLPGFASLTPEQQKEALDRAMELRLISMSGKAGKYEDGSTRTMDKFIGTDRFTLGTGKGMIGKTGMMEDLPTQLELSKRVLKGSRYSEVEDFINQVQQQAEINKMNNITNYRRPSSPQEFGQRLQSGREQYLGGLNSGQSQMGYPLAEPAPQPGQPINVPSMAGNTTITPAVRGQSTDNKMMQLPGLPDWFTQEVMQQNSTAYGSRPGQQLTQAMQRSKTRSPGIDLEGNRIRY